MSSPLRKRPRALVIGNGMTTDRLLDELQALQALTRLQVTVVGEEPYGAYNRVLLTDVLAGASPEAIVTKPPHWYAERGVVLMAGRRVQRLSTAERLAHIGNGETLPYDVAVIATGSSAVVPPVAGLTVGAHLVNGAHVFRDLEDCARLRRNLAAGPGPRQVVVVGGGLLGLEAAKAMRDLGHGVTVVHPTAHLLDAQLDEAGGALVRKCVEDLGIPVCQGRASAALCRPGPDGQQHIEALKLDSGEVLPADVVVLTTGARPRTEVAVSSGIEVDRGIVVDERLATSAEGVFAIGECAERDQTTFGLVAPCWDQASVLANRLSGAVPDARYQMAPLYTRLKVAGIDASSLGITRPGPNDEIVEVHERQRGIYRKLVVRDGVLAGAVLVGDPHSAPRLMNALDRQDPVPANPLDLFCSSAAYSPAVGAGAVGAPLLCTCNRVTRPQVAEAVASGHDTVEKVKRATRAGTGCGSCVSDINHLISERRRTAAA